MDEKRSSSRSRVTIVSYVRRTMPDGNPIVMEFRSVDLSPTGVFLSTEDLGVMDLGEEVELMVATDGDAEPARYYEGRARAVRSARVFDNADTVTESGYGLIFLDADQEFMTAIERQLVAAMSSD